MDVQEPSNNNPPRQIGNINETNTRSENSGMFQNNVNQSNSSSNCIEDVSITVTQLFEIMSILLFFNFFFIIF